ncbi:MAG: bacteriohemerythrin [bacterium]|nr:bacteriohemerythrin [bacterium]
MGQAQPEIQWSKDLEFGIPVIDRDHRMLIEIMNDFITCAKTGSGSVQIHRTLSSLKDYTKMHFDHEETLLKEIGYEDIEEHQYAHKKFKQNIKTIECEFIHNSREDQSISKIRFLLYTWYTNHINNTDRNYVALFKKHKSEFAALGPYKIWDNSMRIGIPEIDREHKALVEILEDLANSLSQLKHSSSNVTTRTFYFLQNYTKLHFAHEENFLEERKYQDLHEHKLKHNEFINNIVSLKSKAIYDPKSSDIAKAVESHLVRWLLEHICDEDQKFSTLR